MRSGEDWYDANKSLTQEEWIQQGFAAAGVKVAIPPFTKEVEPLLELLGRKNEPSLNSQGIMERKYTHPSWLTFNAYRWLLDSDFDAVNYLLDHRSVQLSETIVEGIKGFQNYRLWYVHPGERQKLSFAKPAVDVWDFGYTHTTPAFTAVGYHCAVYTLLLAFWGGGFFLFRRGLRALPIKSAPASPTSHPPSTADGPTDHQSSSC
ncbi:MAG: hypothetical protein JWO89_487 [Verrucomicrobiaceae bacterium]|nr:hypothetical protein [Verrucomicrobiaceae bacterium]